MDGILHHPHPLCLTTLRGVLTPTLGFTGLINNSV